MKTIAFLASILIATSFVPSLRAEEVIKDKSPDGKFALRVTETENGNSAQVIELSTKQPVIDLGEIGPVAADEVKLVWSADSKRAASFNEYNKNHVTAVYFRDGDRFREVALPEFQICGSAIDEDPKNLTTVFFHAQPTYWPSPNVLALTIHGIWKTPKDEFPDCTEDATVVFDAQGKASIDKIEPTKEGIGRKIESPNETFFVEELNTPAKDDEGRPRMDQEVWIVSAKDPAMRERLPGFYEEEGSGVLNGAAISPDENWMLVSQHHGSRLNSTYLLRRKEGLKFEHVFKNDFKERFDDKAWKFFSERERVPFEKIDENDEGPMQVSFLEWSEDSGRLLIDLHGGLTGSGDLREDYKKPGVSLWLVYYNTKTGTFELTDKLRKWNKGARKRWMASDAQSAGVLPPSAESIGHEGADAPVAERLKKYQTELAAIVERRKTQLEGADRAEFEKNEAEWREKLDKEVAQIKDKATQLGLRAKSTWYHLIDVRETWLPVYEPAKVEAKKHPQP